MSVEINNDYLNDRIVKTSNKYLLLFNNRQLLEWYKRYLLRDDIIYLTTYDVESNKLVGLSYRKWAIVTDGLTKMEINRIFPEIKEEK